MPLLLSARFSCSTAHGPIAHRRSPKTSVCRLPVSGRNRNKCPCATASTGSCHSSDAVEVKSRQESSDLPSVSRLPTIAKAVMTFMAHPASRFVILLAFVAISLTCPPAASAAELATTGIKGRLKRLTWNPAKHDPERDSTALWHGLPVFVSDLNVAAAGLISFILHLGDHLAALIDQYGTAVYAILWGIVFCETGLVLTPFLPGDSLLFAAGAFAGIGKLNLAAISAVFVSAAILGDAVNYLVGNKLGAWIQERKLISDAHILQTQKFYAKYGGKTIVLARFVPIVRTFAPFVAGVGSMAYSRFALYNVAGALLWTVLFVGAGFVFGNLPVVQKNFTLVVLGIVVLSVVPVVLEIINARKEAAEGSGPAGVSPSR